FSLPFLGGSSDKLEDAIKQAHSMIITNGRNFARGVIVLLSNTFNQRHSAGIGDASKAFKDDGGVIFTI
ncbi:hypothetical protein PMAYCL1PPCAC_26010, partial [Pristionchus mayeri]